MILCVFKFGLLFPFDFTDRGLLFSKFWSFLSIVNVVFFVILTTLKSLDWANHVEDWIAIVFHAPSLIIVVVLVTHALTMKRKIKTVNMFIHVIRRDLRLWEEFLKMAKNVYLFVFLNFVLWSTFVAEIYFFPDSFFSDPIYFPVFYVLTAMIINIASQYYFFVDTTYRLLKILTKDLALGKYVNLEMTARVFQNVLYVIEHLAGSYSPQVLLIVTLVFTLLINNLYLVISGSSVGWSLLIKAAWGFLISIVGLAVVVPSENVKLQAKEFNLLLYQVLINDHTNNHINNKKLVLHALMRREIVFTACGFFNIDHTLIHSIIASVTTYLIILIQFGNN